MNSSYSYVLTFYVLMPDISGHSLSKVKKNGFFAQVKNRNVSAHQGAYNISRPTVLNHVT